MKVTYRAFHVTRSFWISKWLKNIPIQQATRLPSGNAEKFFMELIYRTYVYRYVTDMGLDIRQLQIASGLIETLLRAGFTLRSIASDGPDRISTTLGIDTYIARIIFDEARKIAAESFFVAP